MRGWGGREGDGASVAASRFSEEALRGLEFSLPSKREHGIYGRPMITTKKNLDTHDTVLQIQDEHGLAWLQNDGLSRVAGICINGGAETIATVTARCHEAL